MFRISQRSKICPDAPIEHNQNIEMVPNSTSFAVEKDVSGTYSFKLFPASTEQFSHNLI